MSINLAEKYIPLLDAKYKKEATTQVLDAPQELYRESINAKTIFIPRVELSGLGNYSRTEGFKEGSVNVDWESHEFTLDRGTQFEIDEADNMETIEVAFARASEQFIRTQVAPEVDAYRFSEMADKADNIEEGDLDETDVLEAIDTAIEVMDNAEVPDTGRVLFVNPTIFRYLKQSNLLTRNIDVENTQNQVNRNIYSLDGVPIVKVPKGRFNSSIDLIDIGESTDGGYDVDGETINFMVVHEDAVLPIVKSDGLRVFNPQTNQNSRGWLFDYRIYHDIFVPTNKTEGIYVHKEEATE